MFEKSNAGKAMTEAMKVRYADLEKKVAFMRDKGMHRPDPEHSPHPERIIERMKDELGHPKNIDMFIGTQLIDALSPFQYNPVEGIGNPNMPDIFEPLHIWINAMQFLRTAEADLIGDVDSVKWTERLDTLSRAGSFGLFEPCTFVSAYGPQVKACWNLVWNMWVDHTIYAVHEDSPLGEEMAYHLRTGFVDFASQLAYYGGGAPAMRQVSLMCRPLAYTANKDFWVNDLRNKGALK